MRQVFVIAPTGINAETAKTAQSIFSFVSQQEPKTAYFKPIGESQGSISQERVRTDRKSVV